MDFVKVFLVVLALRSTAAASGCDREICEQGKAIDAAALLQGSVQVHPPRDQHRKKTTRQQPAESAAMATLPLSGGPPSIVLEQPPLSGTMPLGQPQVAESTQEAKLRLPSPKGSMPSEALPAIASALPVSMLDGTPGTRGGMPDASTARSMPGSIPGMQSNSRMPDGSMLGMTGKIGDILLDNSMPSIPSGMPSSRLDGSTHGRQASSSNLADVSGSMPSVMTNMPDDAFGGLDSTPADYSMSDGSEPGSAALDGSSSGSLMEMLLGASMHPDINDFQ